jgi:hypothetical protein
MLNKTEQSDRAPSPNEKLENCYCSALPNGSRLCLPCYTRWLAGLPRPAEHPPCPGFRRTTGTFSIAITAWSAKALMSRDLLVVERLGTVAHGADRTSTALQDHRPCSHPADAGIAD